MGKDVVYVHSGTLLSYKKEWNLKKEWNNAICSLMDRPKDYHAKWSKSEKEIPHDTTYMWNLK